MLPQRLASICAPRYRHIRKGPSRLTSMTRCHCAAVVSSAAAIRLMPALFTKASAAPYVAGQPLRHLLHERFRGDIARQTRGLRSGGAQPLHLFVDRLQVHENHAIAALRQQRCGRPADALRRSGDYDSFQMRLLFNGCVTNLCAGRLFDLDTEPGNRAYDRKPRADQKGRAPQMMSGKKADDGYADDAA